MYYKIHYNCEILRNKLSDEMRVINMYIIKQIINKDVVKYVGLT
jgi:hypothetical protein